MFDGRWAVLLLQQALQQAENHYRSHGQTAQWRAFEARVFGPCTGLTAAPSLADFAEDTALASPAPGAAAITGVTMCVRTMLRQMVAGRTAMEHREDETAVVLWPLG